MVACGWVLLGLVFIGVACRPERTSSAPALRIGLDLWAGYYPLVLAEALGYLRDENIAVEISVPRDTHRMIADFAARRYDAIAVSLGDVVLLTRDQPAVRMILCSDESAGGDVILGRIPRTEGVDLRGKRVGTSIGGFGEILVRRFLHKHGLRENDVTLLNTDAANVPALLHQGDLDLGHTWEPYASAARLAGCYEWYSSAETPGLILDGLMVHASVVQEHGPALHGVTRAWFRALEWWKLHAEEGNALIEKQLELAPGTVSTHGVRLFDRDDNRRLFATTPEPGALHQSAREFVDHFVSRGILNARIRSEDLLDPTFIK
jgi:NitT/TauT family transport system substrate-binding protein